MLYIMEHFFLTQRGKECFIYENYVYTFDRSSGDDDIQFWRCQAKSFNCKARLHTRNAEVIKIMNSHNHECAPVCNFTVDMD